MVNEKTIDKIKERGYWKVIIRPIKYHKDKIDSLPNLKKIITDCQVMYRGWSYPHIDRIYSGDKYVWDKVDWQNHIEYWRFYQSFQFLNYFAMREDWEERIKLIFGGKIEKPRKSGLGLSVFSSLYTFAEIFEFALRLVQKISIKSDIQLKIDLVNTMDRKLFLYQQHQTPFLDDNYVSKIPEISFNGKYTYDDFLSKSPELSFNCCVYFFERFNWDKIPKDFLRKELYKYISRIPPEKMKKSKKED